MDSINQNLSFRKGIFITDKHYSSLLDSKIILKKTDNYYTKKHIDLFIERKFLIEIPDYFKAVNEENRNKALFLNSNISKYVDNQNEENNFLQLIKQTENFEVLKFLKNNLSSISFKSIYLDEEFYKNYILNSLLEIIHKDKIVDYINFIIKDFHKKYFIDNSALLDNFRYYLYVMKLFIIILIEYEKLRKMGILENFIDSETHGNSHKIEYFIEEDIEVDEEKEKIQLRNILVKDGAELILSYLNAYSDTIRRFTLINKILVCFDSHNIFNMESLFLHSNNDLIRRTIFREELFENFSINMNFASEEEKNRIKADPHFIYNEEFHLKYDYIVMLKNTKSNNDKYNSGNYSHLINVEYLVKNSFIHMISQDLRFMSLYFNYIYNSAKIDFVKDALINDLKLSKLVFNQFIYKYYYYGIKEHYDILKDIIKTIIVRLLKIDENEKLLKSINKNSDQSRLNKEGGKYTSIKIIIEIIEILRLQKFFFKNENNSDYIIDKNYIKYFHVEIFNIIYNYSAEKINSFAEENFFKYEFSIRNNKKTNQYQIQNQHYKENINSINSINLIDLNVNIFEEDSPEILDIKTLDYNINIYYKLVKFLVKDNLSNYYKLKQYDLEGFNNYIDFVLFIINFLKKIMSYISYKINEINNYKILENNTILYKQLSNNKILILTKLKTFILRVIEVFKGNYTKEEQNKNYEFIQKNKIRLIRKKEEENPFNLFIEIKNSMDALKRSSNNQNENITKDLIMCVFNFQVKLMKIFPEDIIITTNISNLCFYFEFIEQMDIIENKLESYSFRNILSNDVNKKDILNLFTFNFSLPIIQNFSIIKLRNYGNKINFNFMNSKENSEFLINLNKINSKTLNNTTEKKNFSLCLNNYEEFKNQRTILANPTKTRFLDTTYSSNENENENFILFADKIENINISGFEVFSTKPSNRDMPKVEIIKSTTTNNFVYMNSQIFSCKETVNDLNKINNNKEDWIKKQFVLIKNKEKIINSFDDSIVITNKAIYIFKEFMEMTNNKKFCVYDFENCKNIKDKIFIKACCNSNSLLLLNINNTVYYAGKILVSEENFEVEKFKKAPEKISFLKDYKCYDFALFNASIFFVLEEKEISENNLSNKRVLYQYLVEGVKKSEKIDKENDFNFASKHMKIIKEMRNISIKNIFSDKDKFLIILTTDNKIFFKGNLNNEPKSSIKFDSYVEWLWPENNNYKILEILCVNRDFAIFSLKKDLFPYEKEIKKEELFQTQNHYVKEYFLIGNYYFKNCFEQSENNKDLKKNFYTYDNPKKLEFFEFYETKFKINRPKEDLRKNILKNSIKEKNNIINKIPVISKSPFVNRIAKPSIISRDKKLLNDLNTKTQAYETNKSIIVKDKKQDKPANISAIKSSISTKEDILLKKIIEKNNFNIERIFYMPNFDTYIYDKYALFFVNNYNDYKYFETINSSTDIIPEDKSQRCFFIVSIYRITKDNLEEYSNISKILTNDLKIADNEIKLIYMILRITIKNNILIITPILKSNEELENNFTKKSYSKNFIMEYFLEFSDPYIQNLNIEKILNLEENSLVTNKLDKKEENFSLVNLNLVKEKFDYIQEIYPQIKNSLFIIEEILINLDMDNPIYDLIIQENNDKNKAENKLNLKCTPMFSKEKCEKISQTYLLKKDESNRINNEEYIKFISLKNKFQNSNIKQTTFKDYYIENYDLYKDENLAYHNKNFKVENAPDKTKQKLTENIFNCFEILNTKYEKAVENTFNLDKKETIRILSANKKFIEDKLKEKFINKIFEVNSSTKIPVIVDRSISLKFSRQQQNSNLQDTEFTQTIFGQVFSSLRERFFKEKNFCEKIFIGELGHTLFHVTLIGEGATDGGGPGREIFTSIFSDLFSNKINLFIPTPNQKILSSSNNVNNIGGDLWTINPNANSEIHFDFFKILGKLMVYSYFSQVFCQMNLPKIFWKKISEDELLKEDLEEIDCYAYNSIVKVAFDDENILKVIENGEEFPLKNIFFTASLSNGVEIDLIENGKNIHVNKNNYKLFRELYLKSRFDEGKKQMEAIKEGIRLKNITLIHKYQI